MPSIIAVLIFGIADAIRIDLSLTFAARVSLVLLCQGAPASA